MVRKLSLWDVRSRWLRLSIELLALFELRKVFALTSGEYLADVKVQVVDATNRVVLDTVTEGPMLLARLPAGSYQVNASFGRAMEHRAVAVSPSALKTLEFRWPTE